MANNIQFTLLKYDANSALLNSFFALRFKVYSEYKLSYYFSSNPTNWDKSPGANFLLLRDSISGEVLGGRRFIIHPPDSDVETYCERNTGKSMAQMLPSLDTNKLYYAEFGSLAFDKQIRGSGLSKLMYQKSFELMQDRNIDFIISNPLKANAARLENAARENGAKQIIWRPDLPSIEDGDHDPTLFVSFKPPTELDLSV